MFLIRLLLIAFPWPTVAARAVGSGIRACAILSIGWAGLTFAIYAYTSWEYYLADWD
jgi:hypothetical protein